MNRIRQIMWFVFLFLSLGLFSLMNSKESQVKKNISQVGKLKSGGSVINLKVGDPAPDFKLPSTSGDSVVLSQYQGKKNVVISFVPASWVQVSSRQWAGYNLAQIIFEKHDTIVLGITVDNIPSLYAWSRRISVDGQGVWFPVLSDFWPHGETAKKYSALRSDGTSERLLFVIDKEGIIVDIDFHDIDERPDLEDLIKTLERIEKENLGCS